MEAWAINFLTYVYAMLGVLSLPSSSDPNWVVREKWLRQPDASYRLHLESTSTPVLCKTSGYVVFPQTYYGLMEIYSDEKLIYTNSVGKKWHLLAALSRPVLSCKYFSDAKKIDLFISSRTQYFASINRYPAFEKSYPFSQFIYEQIYFLSGLLTFIFGIIGGYLLWQLSSGGLAVAFVLYNVGFSILMYAHMPGAVIEVDAAFCHSLVFISLNCALIYFMVFSFGENAAKYLKYTHLFFITISLIFLFTTNGNQNIIQSYIVCFIPFAILGSIVLLIFKIKTGSLIDKILYLFLSIFILKDCYMSQLTRDGFLYLSVIIVITTIVGFIRVLEQINQKKSELENLNNRLASESQILQKLSSSNDIHREIIHDLKSPISFLNFNLKSLQQHQMIMDSFERLKLILNRVESEEVRKNFDWYNVGMIYSKIEGISLSGKYPDMAFKMGECNFKEVEVYLDPLDLEICIYEFLDNAHRYSIKKEVTFDFHLEKDFVRISIKNDLNEETKIRDFGLKGVTSGSSGLGLTGVKKKIVNMGGILSFSDEKNLFTVRVDLRKK